MRPHIALFIPQLSAGGVQRCLLLLAEGFLDKGLQVDFVVGQAEGFFRKMVPAGVNLVDLHSRHIRSALPGLIRYLRASKPAAMLAAQTHANIIATWANKATRHKTRLVISEHNNMSAVVNSARGNMDRYRPILARWFYPWADEIVAVSYGVSRNLSDLTGISPARIHVIYNPLIPRNFDSLRNAPCFHSWFMSKDIPVILAAGRLEKQKDYPTLIQAVEILNRKKPVRMVILGEGAERHNLETLISELKLQALVAMPGYTENVYACMSQASVFVLSSAWEGFPSVLVEAMACGTPVISTNCPSGPDEILAGGDLGRMVPVGKPKAMAKAIEDVLRNPGPLDLARSRASEFTIDQAVRQYMPLLLGTSE